MYVINPKQIAAKQYLQQIYRCHELLQEHLAEIENLRAMSTSIVTPDLTKERVNSSPCHEAPFVSAVNKLVDLEKTTGSKMAELLDLRAEIREIISPVDNTKQILVLRYRYIDFMRWEDIADKMEYSLKSVYRFHSAALDSVADILTAKGKVA